MAETLFLCQLLYWTGRQDDPEGWIHKTQPEIEEETGLGRREQETARRNLKAKDFLEDRRRGAPARLFYRVNVDALNTAWDRISQSSLAESANLESANPPDKIGGKRPTTKGTETTTESKEPSLREAAKAARPTNVANWDAGKVFNAVIKPGEHKRVPQVLRERLGAQLKKLSEDPNISFEIVCRATRLCIDKHKTPTALPLIVQELLDGKHTSNAPSRRDDGPWRNPSDDAYEGWQAS